MKTLAIFGTRPEAIKLAPVIQALQRAKEVDNAVCVTSQHKEMLNQALVPFGIEPDYDLDLMRPSQTPIDILARSLPELDRIVQLEKPDFVIVQGDTTTALSGAMAAYHNKVPVAHVEAGLRSGDINAPFPEEANRKLISSLTRIHFAPTARAAENLEAEGYNEDAIVVTGNTVVDALHYILANKKPTRALPHIEPRRRVFAVTLHRRETLGSRLLGICRALRDLAKKYEQSVDFVFPVHRNPKVRKSVFPVLSGIHNFHLLEPLDYQDFIHLLERSNGVITDSGGIQEESVALGKMVFIVREVTERPEVLECGLGKLVGTDPNQFEKLMDSYLSEAWKPSVGSGSDVFGDGKAADRIVNRLLRVSQEGKSASADAA